MARASVGAEGVIQDVDGEAVVVNSGRLAVETEQDDAFTSWETFPDFAAPTGTALSLEASLNAETGLKEIVIQTDDANTEYVMVGHSQPTTLAGSVGSRAGIKLNGGETLIIAISSFLNVFLIGSTSNQYVNISYFK
jgi:hypothetical protein